MITWIALYLYLAGLLISITSPDAKNMSSYELTIRLIISLFWPLLMPIAILMDKLAKRG